MADTAPPLASHPGIYDAIGAGYAAFRRPDPRIAAQIEAALGDARSVCNVGAGAGGYEPRARRVVALEPSLRMIAQRARGSAPVVRARAEALPFADGAFDAALAVLTIHHWQDAPRGLAELCRIAPRRVVLTFDPAVSARFWLVEDYIPEIAALDERAWPVGEVARALGTTRVEVVPVPADCSDGFLAAYWRRPERYLEPDVRAPISALAQLDPVIVERGIARLRHDLATGRWHERHADLLERDAADFGYRLLIATAKTQ
jgi:SAM-dependent methyltransferase